MVKIRLMRMGATKRPFFRVVVADSRSPRDGRFIENIGKYHPMEDPSLVEIDEDRALYWLSQGAQPTEQARNLLRIVGVWERFEASKGGTKNKPAAAKPAAPAPGPAAQPPSEPAAESSA
jgi:small subunit ribosomal protein S16